jgi:hypothetical protein
MRALRSIVTRSSVHSAQSAPGHDAQASRLPGMVSNAFIISADGLLVEPAPRRDKRWEPQQPALLRERHSRSRSQPLEVRSKLKMPEAMRTSRWQSPLRTEDREFATSAFNA